MSDVICKIVVTDIEWDTTDIEGDTDELDIDLPEEVIIDITEDNEYLLEDIHGYAENLSDYLSDEYGYCHYGFATEVVYPQERDYAEYG